MLNLNCPRPPPPNPSTQPPSAPAVPNRQVFLQRLTAITIRRIFVVIVAARVIIANIITTRNPERQS